MRLSVMVSVLFLAVATSLGAETNQATIATNPTVAYAYLGETASKIGVFAIKKDGSATLVAGSPFSGPSGSIVVSSGFVFGTDGTNIVTYSRLASGGLHVSSTINGTTHNVGALLGTMVLDRSGSVLYASADQGGGDVSYSEFAVQSKGVLGYRNTTATSVDYNSQLQFSNDNKFAYGDSCFHADWDVFSFQRGSDGLLTMPKFFTAAAPPPGDKGICPGAMAVSAKGFLAVGVSGLSQNLAIYRISSSGSLTLVHLNAGLAGVRALRFDPTGTYLAVAGQTGIVTFRLNSTGTLTRLGSVVDSGLTFSDVKWDKSGHVYAISGAGLYVFTSGSAGLKQTGPKHGLSHVAIGLAVLPVN